MTDVFSTNTYYSGPPITLALIERAEEALGVRLPMAYRQLLEERNGGVPVRRRFPTLFPTSWGPDRVQVAAILGIGGKFGLDEPVGGSAYMIKEWGYPDIGVVIADTDSGGDDAIMLDYRECGPDGEPSVVYVDEERVVRQLAPTFSEFIGHLQDWPDDEEA